MTRALTAVTTCLACSGHAPGGPPARTAPAAPPIAARSAFGVSWGMLYDLPPAKPPEFLPELRRLGAGFTRVTLFWSQLEPEAGHYHWEALDALVAQAAYPDEIVVTLYAASPWATRTSAWVFPPSPARRDEDYYRFVHDVVARTRGRVTWFQNESEPNNPMFWSGTPQEWIAQLRVFHRAVKDANPDAVVVLGGCDGLFAPPGDHPIPDQARSLGFFERVLREAPHEFDVFDLHLYADPYTIPGRVEMIRDRMRALGYDRPIIATEYNGPGFFELPANRRYFGLLQRWSAQVASGAAATSPVTALHEHPEQLAAETRMFLASAAPELDARLRRAQGRDLVIRNVLAFASGVTQTAFWDLWHDTSERDTLPSLLYGKLKLVELAGDRVTERYPLAGVFQRMTAALGGMTAIHRIPLGDPALHAYRVDGARARLVVWRRAADPVADDPLAVPLELVWPSGAPAAATVFGDRVPVALTAHRLALAVSTTPIYLTDGVIDGVTDGVVDGPP